MASATHRHIVNFCPLIKFDGGLLHLHEADEAACRQLADNIWLLAHDNNNSGTPDLLLPSEPQGITAHWLAPNYTAW